MLNKIKQHFPTIALSVIFLLALGFRLYRIAVLPGGLFPDEAANGLDINLMEQGQLQPFYERGNGREALFFYMLWASVRVFGRSPFAHHLVSALVGVFAVIVCYFVAKELWFKVRGDEATAKYIGLMSAFLMAVSSWHVVLSRTAFRANLIPLLGGLTIWAMLKSVMNSETIPTNLQSISSLKQKAGKYLPAILFGSFLALGFYTYIAYRIMAPLLIMLLAWPMFTFLKEHGVKNLLKQYWKQTALAILSFCVVFSPLFHYFYTHPGSFVGRSGQVSVFNPELNKGDLVGTISKVTQDSLVAYFTNGDSNWRHNIADFPFLSPLVSTFFGLGLVLCTIFGIRYFFRPIRYKQNYLEFLLVGWFLSMLLPVITTAEGIPHGLRAIGTIPVVFLITVYGMQTVYNWSKRLNLVTSRTLLSAYCLVLISYLPFQTYNLYFVQAANSPEYYEAFRSDLTVVSEYLKANGNRNTTYLILDKFSIQTTDYLTTKIGKTSCDRDPNYRPENCNDDAVNKPYIQVDPERSYFPENSIYEDKPVWPNGLKKGDQIVFTQSSLFDILKFKQSHPNVKLAHSVKNHLGMYILAVYEIQ